MDLDTLFALANLTALIGWIALALCSPWAPRASQIVAGGAIPALLSVGYVALVGASFAGAPGDFASLDGVGRLFSDRAVLCAGWLHYLAFDLIVGAQIARIGRREGVRAGEPLRGVGHFFSCGSSSARG